MQKQNYQYIDEYNRNKYKMYQFRVNKQYDEIIKMLDEIENRNKYLIRLLEDDIYKKTHILTLKQIKSIAKPIMAKWNIKEIYLFGSYARGEANKNSDVDFYCEKGNAKTLIEQAKLINELEESLCRHVDLIFISTQLDEEILNNIKEDMIKLC